MIITHKIKMDLISKGIAPKIHMVQGDCCSRKIEFRLFSDRAAWHVPKGAKALIRYRRPDHSVGVYDTLPDGTCAYAVSGNAVTVSVAPEALAIAGYVSLVITLSDAERELSTFEVQLDVQPNFTSGPAAEGDYASITGMIQTPDHAQVGQTVVVAAVNESGKPTKWEAADFPELPVQKDCVPLDGSEEMTGWLKTPRIEIKGNSKSNLYPRTKLFYDGVEIGSMDIHPDTHQVRLMQVTPDTGKTEVYTTPAPQAGLTKVKQYELLTSRKPVTLTQGGTGATTAEKARENLGAAAAVHTHDDRYYTQDEIDALLPKAFYVNITDNGDGTGTADKPRSEAAAAFQAGKSVYALFPDPDMGKLVMPLLYVDPDTGTIMFGAKDIISGATKVAMYSSVDELQILAFPGGVCIVTVTDLGNTVCSIDKSLTEILAATMVGTVCAKMTIDDTVYTFPLVSEDANYYIFSGDVGSDLCEIFISKNSGNGIWARRSIEAPNPYALTINGTQYDGTYPVSMTIEPDGFVVDYVQAEAARVAKLVQSRQNANTFSFMVGADIHARLGLLYGGYTTAEMLASAKHAAQAMDIIRQQTHMDFGAILGDTLWDSGETADQAMDIFRTIRAYFHPAFVGAPQFWLKGNHDYLGDDAVLTDDQVYAGISIHNTDVVFDNANKAGGYCYRDFADHQLRVICLALPEDGKGYGISAAQISWLRDALDVSSKGANWKTLILSHMPIDDFAWVTDFMSVIVGCENTIIANIHGHTHNYQTGIVTDTSIPRIGIPAICPYRTKDTEGNEGYDAPYQKVENTAEDTAFCVITIDFAAKKIYADHYGAGEDRVIDYTAGTVSTSYTVTYKLTNVSSSSAVDSVESGNAYSTQLTVTSGSLTSVNVTMGGTDITDTAYSDGNVSIAAVTGNIVITAVAGEVSEGYTNMIQKSTSAFNGTEIYNGIGYKAGYRLNSSAEEAAADGMCCTGFIPVANADVLRFKNVTLDAPQTPYLIVYTSTGGHGESRDISVLGDPDDNGVYTYTISGSYGNSGVGAIRLSCGVIDDTSIITVNQEIS